MTKLPYLISFKDLINSEIPPPEPFIEGFLSREELIIISGPKKLGKTLFSSHMAYCLGYGIPWFNYVVPKPRRVLYMQNEVSPATFKSRILRQEASLIKTYKDKLLDTSFDNGIQLYWKRGFKLDNETQHNETVKMIRDMGCDILIVDPLSMYHDKEENSNKEMAEFFDHLIYPVIEDCNMSVVITHHHGKGGFGGSHSGSDLHRGASVIGDRPDVNVMMTRLKRASKNMIHPVDEYCRLEIEARNFKAPDPVVMWRNEETLIWELDDTAGRQQEKNAIVKLVQNEGGLSKSNVVGKLNGDFEMSRATVYRLINELIEDGNIEAIELPNSTAETPKVGLYGC